MRLMQRRTPFRMGLVAVVTTASAALAACSHTPPDYMPNPLLVQTTELYTQPPTEQRFPTHVASYARESILQHDRASRDVSVRYRDPNPLGGVIVTVHLFAPNGRVAGSGEDERLEREFEWRKREFQKLHPKASLSGEQTSSLEQNDTAHAGRLAEYRHEGVWDGQTIPLVTREYVFAINGGAWLIDYEFSWPQAFDGAEDSITAFLKGLRWTVPPAAVPG